MEFQGQTGPLPEIEGAGEAGHVLDDPRARSIALVLYDDFRLIVQNSSGRVVCTDRGMECVAAAIRLDKETAAKKARETRNAARRSRRQKLREAR